MKTLEMPIKPFEPSKTFPRKEQRIDVSYFNFATLIEIIYGSYYRKDK